MATNENDQLAPPPIPGLTPEQTVDRLRAITQGIGQGPMPAYRPEQPAPPQIPGLTPGIAMQPETDRNRMISAIQGGGQQLPRSSLGDRIAPGESIPEHEMIPAYRAYNPNLSEHQAGQLAYHELRPQLTAQAGSDEWDRQRIQQIEFDRAHPWGAPISAHPGTMGRIGHVLGTIGNIAGDILAPRTMALFPQTQLGSRLEEAGLRGDIAEQQRLGIEQQTADARLQQAQAEMLKAQNPEKFNQAALIASYGSIVSKLNQTPGLDGQPYLPNEKLDDPMAIQDAARKARQEGKLTPEEEAVIPQVISMGKAGAGELAQKAGAMSLAEGEQYALAPGGEVTQLKNIPLVNGSLPEGTQLIGKPTDLKAVQDGAQNMDIFATSFNRIVNDSQDFWDDPVAGNVAARVLAEGPAQLGLNFAGVGVGVSLPKGANEVIDRTIQGLVKDPRTREQMANYITDFWNLQEKVVPAMMAMQGEKIGRGGLTQMHLMLNEFPTKPTNAAQARRALSEAAMTFSQVQQRYGRLIQTPVEFPGGQGALSREEQTGQRPQPGAGATLSTPYQDYGAAPADKKDGDTGVLPDGTKVVVNGGRIIRAPQ